MNRTRRLLGKLIYLVFGLPALVGGLFLFSLRPVIQKPEKLADVLSMDIIEQILISDELLNHLPETFTLGDNVFSLPASIKTLQGEIDPSLVSETLKIGLESILRLDANRPDSISLDISVLKREIAANADSLARIYLQELETGTFPIGDGLVPSESPEAIAGIIREALASIPDIITPANRPMIMSEPGMEMSVYQPLIETIKNAILGGSIWFSLTGLGITIASAFISESEWRKRLGMMGRRLFVPGIVFGVIGLIPFLINTNLMGSLFRMGESANYSLFSSTLHSLAKVIAGGFLWTGLGVFAAGFAINTGSKLLPPSSEEEELYLADGDDS